MEEDKSIQAEFRKERKPAKKISKSWWVLLGVMVLVFAYEVGKEQPQSIGEFGFSLATLIGYFIGSSIPALFITVLSRLFSGKWLANSTFANITIGVVVIGFLGLML